MKRSPVTPIRGASDLSEFSEGKRKGSRDRWQDTVELRNLMAALQPQLLCWPATWSTRRHFSRLVWVGRDGWMRFVATVPGTSTSWINTKSWLLK